MGHSTVFSTMSGGGLCRNVNLVRTVFIVLLAGLVSFSLVAPISQVQVEVLKMTRFPAHERIERPSPFGVC
jgi:hypothetical protein